MTKKIKGRLVAAALSFLFMICFAANAFAQEESGKLGGAIPERKPDTEIWAGVSVDYMFPLRYEVYGADGLPLADVSIEHYDYNTEEYVYVGRTDQNGMWETQVPAGYFNNVIIGGAQGVSVADTRALYEGNKELKHRLSKDGFLIVEGVADYTLELNDKREQVIVVRVTMENEPSSSESTSESTSQSTSESTSESTSSVPSPGGSSQPSQSSQTTSTGSTLPSTGVPSYWIFLAVGSLLLLLAALIICKILYDEQKNRKKNKAGGELE